MPPTPHGSPRHTGTERYEVTLVFGPDDLKEINRLVKPGEIITDTVVLVWERQVGQKWERATKPRTGSRAEGYPKPIFDLLYGERVRRTRGIYSRDLGEILSWTNHLPGLRQAVGQAEAQLPD